MSSTPYGEPLEAVVRPSRLVTVLLSLMHMLAVMVCVPLPIPFDYRVALLLAIVIDQTAFAEGNHNDPAIDLPQLREGVLPLAGNLFLARDLHRKPFRADQILDAPRQLLRPVTQGTGVEHSDSVREHLQRMERCLQFMAIKQEQLRVKLRWNLGPQLWRCPGHLSIDDRARARMAISENE